MLRELWDSWTAAALPEARTLGFPAEVAALAARYRRQRRAWAPHIAACRAFIAEAAGRAEPGSRALVVGSGLLIEVPVLALAARFSEVVLVDLVQARAVRRRVRGWANVRLASVDASGALAGLAEALAQGRAPPIPGPSAAFAGESFGFAVSCNLLSQLPLLPVEAMARAGVGEEVRARWAAAAIGAHLDWLKGLAPVAALYTDSQSRWRRDGRIAFVEDSLWGLALAPPDRAWDWDIAPAPEEDRRLDRIDRVDAWFQGPAASEEWEADADAKRRG